MHCDKDNCPNRGWHENTETWKSLMHASANHFEKYVVMNVDYFPGLLRVTISVNSQIVLRTEIIDPTGFHDIT